MKTSLNHLPSLKQQELTEITQLILQQTSVEMIILFGSFARGDWVEEYAEDGVHFQYQSDFDLLVIVETRSSNEQYHLERELEKMLKQHLTKKTPVSLIVHDIEFVNRRLAKAQYFFSDIIKDGICLYNSQKLELRTPKEPKELSNKERYQLAKEDFQYYFEKVKKLLLVFRFYLDSDDYSGAAFELHQATERLYSAILLVFTRYKPNTHKLKELRALVNALDRRFVKVFPLTTKEEERCFELLCDAYVDARYKPKFVITEDELKWLANEIQKLNQLTDVLCQEKMRGFLSSIK